MKNQYFGDVNDYRKYGILRLLSDRQKIRLCVCWMLTDDDSRTDGKFTDYLLKPNIWRHHDPELFDVLHDSVVRMQDRHVGVAQTRGILPAASFHTAKLSDDWADRKKYFDDLSLICEHNLIFFDPDNGLEVKSVKKGRRGSSKYLYWDEFGTFFKKGHSILIYQHFPREKHDSFVSRIAEEIMIRSAPQAVIVFQTRNVAFFLVPQDELLDEFNKRSQAIEDKWKGQVWICRFHHWNMANQRLTTAQT